MNDTPVETENAKSDLVYTSDGPMCCHGCGYQGDEASYPDPKDENLSFHFELDDDGLFLWHDPACPRCGSIVHFGHVEHCFLHTPD